MAIIKSYTDIEQSKKLAEILPLESADMEYLTIKENSSLIGVVPFVKDDSEVEDSAYNHIYDRIACWSLAALLDTLKLFTTPTAFSVKVCVPLLTKTNNGYSLTYTGDYTLFDKNNFDIAAPIETVADNPVDACYEMILKLKENKLI